MNCLFWDNRKHYDGVKPTLLRTRAPIITNLPHDADKKTRDLSYTQRYQFVNPHASSPTLPLVIQDLSFSFDESPDVLALKSLNFQLKKAEIVILKGPSGSGKTTLLTLCGALRSPRSGRLDILGKAWGPGSGAPLTKAKQRVLEQELRPHIGFVFQQHNLFKALTAQQNVDMALELHARQSAQERRALSQKMLAQVGLATKCESYPAQLSGGQRQRVAVARALVNTPALLLADEPTASLDHASALEVMGCFRQAAAQWGCSVLMVTHDHRLFDSADRVVSMEDGRMV
jgi:putative ABC transport system ATP-binding protein